MNFIENNALNQHKIHDNNNNAETEFDLDKPVKCLSNISFSPDL